MSTDATATPVATNNQVQVAQKQMVDSVLAKVSALSESGGLKIPTDYSAENALRSAWLMFQESDKIIGKCTDASIANSLLNMVVQGLNPAKRQCSFIPYGNKLTLQREYQGSVAVAKRHGLKTITANAIFEGDEFSFEIDVETGKKKILKHVSTFESFGGTVKGAYAILEMTDGSKSVEVMSMAQIQAAWNQGATKGQSPAHKNFPDQMACKTVINRAVKGIINSSDDADLFEDDPITQEESRTTAAVKQEVAAQSNGANGEDPIGFTESEDVTNQAQTIPEASEIIPSTIVDAAILEAKQQAAAQPAPVKKEGAPF